MGAKGRYSCFYVLTYALKKYFMYVIQGQAEW